VSVVIQLACWSWDVRNNFNNHMRTKAIVSFVLAWIPFVWFVRSTMEEAEILKIRKVG